MQAQSEMTVRPGGLGGSHWQTGNKHWRRDRSMRQGDRQCGAREIPGEPRVIWLHYTG